jgi:hypothetical protein
MCDLGVVCVPSLTRAVLRLCNYLVYAQTELLSKPQLHGSTAGGCR